MTEGNRKDISPSELPEETIGRCTNKLRSGKRCRVRGDLADGMCMQCWDANIPYPLPK